MTVAAQLELPIAAACKERGCLEAVVGYSVTGNGHVCKRHNEGEWGRALLRSEFADYRALGASLVLAGVPEGTTKATTR